MLETFAIAAIAGYFVADIVGSIIEIHNINKFLDEYNKEDK